MSRVADDDFLHLHSYASPFVISVTLGIRALSSKVKADVRGDTVTSLLVATDAFAPIQHAPAVMHFIDEVLGLHDEVLGLHR